MKQPGRISILFDNKSRKEILNVYCTAGYPELDSTMEVLKALQDNGADMIEIGMPYSDPLADGAVIQASSARAIANGMTLKKLFEQLKNLRKEIRIPVVLMGYMNPVLQYGFEKFCEQAAACGIDGLILPDLPEFEYETEFGPIIHKHGLDFIFLVTPETSDERVRRLDSLSSGFLYAVSSSSTTGNYGREGDWGGYLERLNSMGLKLPILVGFGIKDRASFLKASRSAAGAIIGTAYIQALASGDSVQASTRQFLSSIKG